MRLIRDGILLIVLLAMAAGGVAARGSREAGDLVGPEEAFEMVRSGDAILVDVRNEASYIDAHIAGAILVPLVQVGASAEMLEAREQTIITYCACPAEETSVAAASELIARGVEDVLVLRGGIREWALADLPMKSGPRP